MKASDLEKLKGLESHEIESVLSGEAVVVEVMSYARPLTRDEIATFKDDLTQICIRRAQYEKELEDVKSDYKLKLDPLKKLLSSTIEALKNETIQVDDDVYQIPDYESGVMLYVDNSGYLINQRPLLDSERKPTKKGKLVAMG
jgi:hypothetical protein